MKRIFTAAMLFLLITVTGVAITKLGANNRKVWADHKAADVVSTSPTKQ